MSAHKKILIIEDEIPAQKLFERLISRLGYETVIAANGSNALELLAESSDDFILIITDLILPYFTGWEFLTHLKENALYGNIKTLVISGVSPSAEERARLEELCDRVMLKSEFSVGDFEEVLNELLFVPPKPD
jgi:CheY-like chemotaxis protein